LWLIAVVQAETHWVTSVSRCRNPGKIKEWVGHAQVTIQPVLDLGRGDAVDVHDAPAWMRETVILRDRHCVFPGCRVDARSCDQDHIEPYLDPGEGGPLGQTSADNLASR
jgi:hypothetical protein